jgi:hypothetical protein
MYAASRTNDDIIDHASVADASLIALHLSLVELDLFQWVEPVSKIVERDSCFIILTCLSQDDDKQRRELATAGAPGVLPSLSKAHARAAHTLR